MQTAILLPVVILLIIAAVQATLWFAGRQVAIAAASEGARVAAAETGTTGSGQTAATQFASTTGRGFLLVPSASVTRTATTATVTVTGRTQSLVAGWDLTITQTASMPVERLTAPTGTGGP
ncbi:TadE family protein [Promicromonospora sukumoe]|uniref:TadE family protein n=1 Tax=Promicromonospora sukumoe TaxID=88382 RepID=UPI0037C5C445